MREGCEKMKNEVRKKREREREREGAVFKALCFTNT